jgi:hypothetical protein
MILLLTLAVMLGMPVTLSTTIIDFWHRYE